MNRLSVLVISCDRYADIWTPFFTLFWRYWPDCPYPVFLGSNQRQFNHPQVNALPVGPDRSWAENAQRMADAIPSEYVLIMLEDFFLYDHVDTKQINELFGALLELEGVYLRLKPFPKPDHKISEFPLVGLIEPGAPYRAALQATIWKRDVFLRMLRTGETPWQMELRGSVRSEKIPESFFSVWQPALHYQAGVTLGCWKPSALNLLKREGIVPDRTARPVISGIKILEMECKRRINYLINMVPWKIRRRIGDSLRKNGWLSTREA